VICGRAGDGFSQRPSERPSSAAVHPVCAADDAPPSACLIAAESYSKKIEQKITNGQTN
jgi:hypothetical protein